MEILIAFHTKIEKPILKFIGNSKELQIGKTKLKQKQSWMIYTSDFEIYAWVSGLS